MEDADVDRHEKANRPTESPYDTRRKPRKAYTDSLILPDTKTPSASPIQATKRKRAAVASEPSATLPKAKERESSTSHLRVCSRVIDGHLQHTYTMRDKTELKADGVDCPF